MKLSTRTRYGTRALAELAAAYPGRAVSAKELAARQRLSAKYLEQILGALRKAGLVGAERGTHGGYVLARPPEEVTLAEVFSVLEGPTAPVACVDNPGSCALADVCPTRETWVEMTESIDTILSGTTLKDLADRKKRKSLSSAAMYHI